MKSILYTLLICLFSISIAGQVITGTVYDESGNPLWGATVQSLDQGVACDSLGRYTLTLAAGNRHPIRISYVGLQSIDTILFLSKEIEVFNWTLRGSDNTLEEVVIRTDVDNLFENFKAHIIDFTIKDDFFYCLVDNYQNKLLIKANLEGKVLRSIKLEEDFFKIRQSCLGGIILLGTKKCMEVQILAGRIIQVIPFDIKTYEALIEPCIYRYGDVTIFQHITQHNKRSVYYRYNEDKKQVPIYTVFDKEGAMVSNSYYRDIIGAYYREVIEAGEDDIDFGFQRDNLIKEGRWDGNVQDLILTNFTHKLVGEYLSLAYKLVRSDIVPVGQKCFIFDWVNQTYHQMDNKEGNIIYSDSLPEFKEPILHSSFQGSSILVEKDKYIFHLSLKNDQVTFNKHQIPLDQRYIIQRSIYYKDQLYRLGRMSLNDTKNQIFVQRFSPN